MLGKIWLFLLLAVHTVRSNEVLYRETFIDKNGKVTIQDVPFEQSRKARIVGGTEAEPHSSPYTVALTFSGDSDPWFCGGALIDASWVVTSGSCVVGAQSVDVLLGAHNRLDSSESSQVTVTSSNLILHYEYNSINLQNNIALIQFDSPVNLTDEIQPIALSAVDPEDGTMLTMTGWGSTVDGVVDPTDTLNEVDVPSISNDECSETWAGTFVYPGLLCTEAGGKGACDGDYGTPLSWGEDDRITLVGVVSFTSSGGCTHNDPQASSRIPYFLYWIKDKSGVTPDYCS